VPRTLQEGARVGPYRLHEQIGEGAVGRLFRAAHETGGVVALKVLRDELAADPIYVRRFQREAAVARGIRHANLVSVVDAGKDTSGPYLAAQYVDGRSLEARIRGEGALGLAELLRVVTDVGAGLTALHEHRLVHRDVKPANVMLDRDGTALLTDFGLAKGPAMTSLTRSGLVLGTPQYLAPELIDATAEATPASDVYALGCLVYACLAGRPPFIGSLMEVAWGQLEEEPPDPCAGRDDVPAGVSRVVLQALAKDPAARPISPTMLAHLLRAAASAPR
jgi:serine/threonine protein kinase